MNRIVGLETEYGCLAPDSPAFPSVVHAVRDWAFNQEGLGLVDLHQRDWDEPAGNGGFLFNGGRLYVDMGHLEYCTPECRSLVDILRYDRAGDEILNNGLSALGLSTHASFIRNNIDHYSGATFGCHENYLVRRTAPLTERNVKSLLAFLTLRVLYTGAGRVGAARKVDPRTGGADLLHPCPFQMSQRADYINNDLFEWVQFNRAIINTRDEPLADGTRFRRLHLLHGDTSVLPASLLLKVGTTTSVLDLLEINALPGISLADPVATLHQLSRNTRGPWLVTMEDGGHEDAVELLHRYASAARQEFSGRDNETDFLVNYWTETIELLPSAREALVGRIDWVTKKWLFERFMEEEKISWEDPWLKSQDLEFHHTQAARSLGLALERTPVEWSPGQDEITAAMRKPPSNTRARVRSFGMSALREKALPYYLDWEMIGLEGGPVLALDNPFDSNPKAVQAWIDDLDPNPPTTRKRETT